MAKRLLLIFGLIACAGLNPFELAVGAEPLATENIAGVGNEHKSSPTPVSYDDAAHTPSGLIPLSVLPMEMANEGGLVYVLQLRQDKHFASLPSALQNRVRLGEEALRLKRRVSSLGYEYAVFTISGSELLLLSLPGTHEAESLDALLTTSGRQSLAMHLEFPEAGLAPGESLPPEVTSLPLGSKEGSMLLYASPSMDVGEHIVNVETPRGVSGEPYITLELDAAGSKIFERITQNNIGRRLALVVEGRILMAPVIQDKISEGKVSITGRFEPDEFTDAALKIYSCSKAGAPLSLLEKRVIAPAVGKGVGS